MKGVFELANEDSSKEKVIKSCVKYLLREENFTKSFNHHFSSKNINSVRKRVCCFDLMVRLKISIMKCLKENVNRLQAISIFIKNGLTNRDVYIWDYVKKMKLPRTRKWLKESNRIPTVKELEEDAIETVYSGSVEKAIKRIVRSKLRFVTSSQAIELIDLENEVKANALESYFMTAPFLTREHIKPSVVSSAKNFVLKLINYYTFAKRSRLIRKDGKFLHTTVSIDEKIENVKDGSDLDRYWFAALDNTTDRDMYKIEYFNTICSMKKYVKCEKAQFALTIFGSSISADTDICIDRKDMFIMREFLNVQSERLGTEIKNTIHLVDELGESRFLVAVRKFIKYSVAKWRQLLDWIREFSSHQHIPVFR